MDLASFGTLISVIASPEVKGSDTGCFACMAGLPAGIDPEDPYHLRKGALEMLPNLLRREDHEYRFTPTNWWSADRSWFVLTDYELQALK